MPMVNFEVKSGLVYYYGNPAGYVEDDNAIIDTMFKNDELAEWLAEKKGHGADWRDGVFHRLSTVKVDAETGQAKKFKDCRIWQLKPDVDPLIKYVGYDEAVKIKGGPPDLADYKVALDFQPNTDNIDEICAGFNERPNANLVGGTVNLSDIIEIYDSSGSEFNYADRIGFVEMDFKHRQEQNFESTANQLLN